MIKRSAMLGPLMLQARKVDMRLTAGDPWLSAMWFCAGLTGAAAGTCEAERYGAADTVVRQAELLRFASESYRAAMATGDLASFDEVAPLVVQEWNGLMLTISRERRRLRETGCRDDGFTDPQRLPSGWTTVREVGPEEMMAGDRTVTVRRARARFSTAGPR